jgi:microcystin-dependent protein
MTLIIEDEAALFEYMEAWAKKRLGKTTDRRHFLATVAKVSLTRPYSVQVQRLDETHVDLNSYLCATPGYSPQIGDTVDVLWFDDTLGYIMWPISGPSLLSAGVPTGSVNAFAGAAAPAGWLICNGAAVSRTTYVALFSVLASTYGAGDGSTTFNLPDMRGRAPIGAGTGSGLSARTLAAKMGEENHVLSVAELASHSHDLPLATGSGLVWVLTSPGGSMSGSYGITSGNAGSGSGHNNMPPSIALNYIVKT